MNANETILSQFKTREEQDKFFDQYLSDPQSVKFIRSLKVKYKKRIDKMESLRTLVLVVSIIGLVCNMITVLGCAGSYDLGVETQETRILLIASVSSIFCDLGLIVFSETHILTRINKMISKYNYCLNLIDTLKTIKE